MKVSSGKICQIDKNKQDHKKETKLKNLNNLRKLASKLLKIILIEN